MDSNWSYQMQNMTQKLFDKRKQFGKSHASPKQALDITCTVAIPSTAYALPVTPCSPVDLNQWDALILYTVKEKVALWGTTCTALLHEDNLSFGF
eukprot:1158661-Pelagomonas_calceolata.AAC.1